MGATVDPESKYHGAQFFPHGEGYWRVRDPESPVAGKNGLAGLHRAVAYEAYGAGPLTCGLCGMGGLEWRTKHTEPHALVIDHIDHDRSNNRLANLRAVHKWCNDNRDLIERHGIPWSHFTHQHPTDRIAIRIAGGPRAGQLTPNAQILIASLTNEPEAEPLTLSAEEPLDEPAKVRQGITTWTQATGSVPESLAEKYGWLKGIE